MEICLAPKVESCAGERKGAGRSRRMRAQLAETMGHGAGN
jgi:hypothetical protein